MGLSLKEKQKKMAEMQAQVNKKFGEGALMTGKQAVETGALDKVIYPTPSLELNKALYCGGFSGVVELFGAPASGKTSLAIEVIAKSQKEDPDFYALWLETESSITQEILQQHGIDISRIAFIDQANVDNAESALDIAYGMIVQGIPNIVVINSVAGFLPKQEFESDFEKQNVGRTAQLMSKTFRKFIGPAAKNKITMIFINQLRDKIGVMFGDPSTTTGGRALAFYANQRIKMNANKIQASDPITADEGIKVSCIVHKNRFSGNHNPNTQCYYYARFDTGIDSIIGIPQELLDKGIFTKGGAWWYYPNKENIQTIAGVECKFNSKDALLETLRTNEQFLKTILDMLSVDEVSEEEKAQIAEEEAQSASLMRNAGEIDTAEE